jgi:lipid-binding SYLF domain-containing protein
MKGLQTIRLLLAVLLIWQPADATWEADGADKSQVKAAQAISNFRENVPRTEQYFEQAYGYAILPSVTRIGFGFGGAYGKGFVIEGDNAIGTTKFFQFTSGLQAGAKNFSMIVFFKDKEALDYYKSGKIQFLGQAGLAFATVGVAGTPAYNDGVAMVTVTRLGLMGEFSYSGARFSYKPLSKE